MGMKLSKGVLKQGPTDNSTEMKGLITRLISVRGFGFVRDSEGRERFLHVDDLLDVHQWPSLRVGQTLMFFPRVRVKGGRNKLGVRGARGL